MTESLTPYKTDSPLEPMREELTKAPLTQEQYQAAKDYWLRSEKKDAWRNVIILMLLRNTGFRPSEVVRTNKTRKHFGQGGYLTVGQFVQHGSMYWVNVLRAKKRNIPDYEPVILSPTLGRALVDYIAGNNLRPHMPMFDISVRQLQNVWYEACVSALGYKKEVGCLRDLYIITVAKLANHIVGYTPIDLGIASKMVGHSDIRTTRLFYEKVTPEQKRQIQESIQV